MARLDYRSLDNRGFANYGEEGDSFINLHVISKSYQKGETNEW